MNIFWFIYFKIAHFFLKIHQFFFKKLEQPLVLDKTTQYIENQKTRFLKAIEYPKNSNIDSLFYSKKEFQEMLIDETNSLESTWKTRILCENTPRGNIIMYFDAYKIGFSYYADTAIPYNVLNAVAMKYVSVYNCHDFFLDNEIKDSPLIKIHIEEEPKAINQEITKKRNDKRKMLEDAPFAKLKNYSKNTKNTKESKDAKDTKEPAKDEKKKDYNRNRFICLGKITNFQIIKKQKRIFHGNGFKTNLLDGVKTEGELQKTVMNYRDYKNILRSAKSN